ncbi:MAG: thiamine-phosphate kinase [Acidobacteriota bacterium]|nr:thiamine-phosphate kinase [Acidobacteriota bacterium]
MAAKPIRRGELGLIAHLRRQPQRGFAQLTLGIGDDCAILKPPANSEIVVTTDFSLEGRHFLRHTHPARAVGHRCLARGLSDLAAMGARPLAAFLSLALPEALAATRAGQRWVDEFLAGLLTLASQHGVPLAGGDTAGSPSNHVLADITLLGSTPTGRALRRSGACPNDVVYVTGALGGAAAELAQVLRRRRPAPLRDAERHPHLLPQARLAVGQALLRRGLATACIDLSDGLSTDLRHLCAESHVDAVLEAARLPQHPLLARLPHKAAWPLLLHGGEDYELLFTAPPTVRVPRRICGVAVTRIGHIVRRRRGQSEPQVLLQQADGSTAELRAGGWQHLTTDH